MLAKGERRDFVIVDRQCEVHSLARRIDGYDRAVHRCTSQEGSSHEAPKVSAAMHKTINVENVVCSAETMARHPELYHYTRPAAFEGIISW